MNLTLSRTLPRRQSGTAAVELALVLTLLITLVAGIVELGRTFWYYDALSKATRNAARTLSVSLPATIATTGAAAARNVVLDAAASAGVPAFDASQVEVKCMDASFNAFDCSDGTAPAGVKVSIVGYSLLLGTTIPFLLGATSNYTVNLAPGTTMPYMK